MKENNETIIDTRVYELAFVLDDKMEESAAIAKAESFKEAIATMGGSFISEEAPYLRELAYEMIRVVNNVNVRFNRGYFSWVKFNLDPANVALIDKKLKLDEEVVRYMVVKTVEENTIFTKRTPVVTLAALASNEDGESDEVVAVEAAPVSPKAE